MVRLLHGPFLQCIALITSTLRHCNEGVASMRSECHFFPRSQFTLDQAHASLLEPKQVHWLAEVVRESNFDARGIARAITIAAKGINFTSAADAAAAQIAARQAFGPIRWNRIPSFFAGPGPSFGAVMHENRRVVAPLHWLFALVVAFRRLVKHQVAWLEVSRAQNPRRILNLNGEWCVEIAVDV